MKILDFSFSSIETCVVPQSIELTQEHRQPNLFILCLANDGSEVSSELGWKYLSPNYKD